MRTLIQRVSQARVRAEGELSGEIGAGLLVLLGIGREDGEEDLDWLLRKLVGLRIFEDEAGKMNRSLVDIDGEALVVSQFTLFGEVKKGSRPSFNRSAPPEIAIPLYERFVQSLSERLAKPVPTGVFGAMMEVELTNDGPVTLMLDSRQRDY